MKGHVEIQEELLQELVAQGAVKLAAQLGPHIADLARARAPVGRDRDFNPQTKSFRTVRLKPIGTFGASSGSQSNARAARLLELHGMSPRERAKSVNTLTEQEFFSGTGKNKGQTPGLIEVQRGTIRGAFEHKPGTLRDSIRYDGLYTAGGRAFLRVTAHAPYAAAVHQGFTHRGGRKHQGKGTKIAPRPFFAGTAQQAASALKG